MRHCVTQTVYTGARGGIQKPTLERQGNNISEEKLGKPKIFERHYHFCPKQGRIRTHVYRTTTKSKKSRPRIEHF